MYRFLNDHIPSLSGPHPEDPDGKFYVFEFPNGFGASVIQNKYSYGNDQGLWELAVLDEKGNLFYDSGITDDVIGYLNEDAVSEMLYRISGLSKR
jgi:hypothetical protein